MSDDILDNSREDRLNEVIADYLDAGQQRVEWYDNIAAKPGQTDDLLAIDDALTQLAEEDAESAQLVNLRFYAGLSVEEADDVMGLPRATAYRTWNYAKAWLRTKVGDAAVNA